MHNFLPKKNRAYALFFLSMENPQLGWGFRKAFSF
ncbi:MFS transporter, partial [Salmonella enterica subsp. enterica serovar Choleraesuis]|nr:MFS transporter [Salmonella enterica subsp. enterica serovar Choleraesuis]